MRVLTPDEEIGRCRGVLFDDQSWSVRHLVVETGEELGARTILISPSFVDGIEEEKGSIRISLTKAQAAAQPDIDSDMPVSRLKEAEHGRAALYMPFWSGSGAPHGEFLVSDSVSSRSVGGISSGRSFDPHLRSSEEVMRYRVHARDGRIGRVRDFMVDEADWLIRHIEVRIRRWPRAREVLLSPLWVVRVSWRDQALAVSLSREQVGGAPQWNASSQSVRDYETGLLVNSALPAAEPWFSPPKRQAETPKKRISTDDPDSEHR